MKSLDRRFLTTPIAHRALHDVNDGRPENSRAAILAAIAAGYGIEIDLQLSGDNVPMVFHDYDLERLTQASGSVKLQPADSLSKVQLKGGAEGIPNLKEVLELVDGRVPILVEFKDQDGQMGPNVGLLEAAAAPFLNSYSGPIAVMSFNPHSVSKLAKLCPDVPRGFVTCSFSLKPWSTAPDEVLDHLRDIQDYDRVGASFISHEVAGLDFPRVAELKAKGANVLCWTVTSPAMEAKAREVAENITFEQYLAKHPT